MQDVLNAGEQIDFANHAFVEFMEVFNGSDSSVLLGMDKSWESPCTFPNVL
jgi:hypothetical protein